jgi:hypothetical protein
MNTSALLDWAGQHPWLFLLLVIAVTSVAGGIGTGA